MDLSNILERIHIKYDYFICLGIYGPVIRGIHKSGVKYCIKCFDVKSTKIIDYEVKVLEYLKMFCPESDSKRIPDIICNQDNMIVMKYIEGRTLRRWITDMYYMSDKVNNFKRIIYSIAEVLTYIHNNFIIHGDIKPLNIVIDNAEKAHLIDFGLSIIMNKINTKVLDAKLIQTWCYRAPEVILEIPYTDKVDVWSFGIVLLEMLIEDEIVKYFDINQDPQNIFLLKSLRTIFGEIPYDLIYQCDYKKQKEIYNFISIWGKANNIIDDIIKKYGAKMGFNEDDISKLNDLLKGMLNMDPKKRFSSMEVKKFIEKFFC